MRKKEKCAFCDKPAIAYVLERDGSRRYLCEDHIPDDDVDAPRPDGAKPAR